MNWADIFGYWQPVNRNNRVAGSLIRRHYTRARNTGHFCRPGLNLVLLGIDGKAVWISHKNTDGYKRWDGLDAIECTVFRNEGERLSSELVEEAVILTESKWGRPADGWVTYVDARKVKSTNPGFCFLKAGFWKDRSYSHPFLIRLRK